MLIKGTPGAIMCRDVTWLPGPLISSATQRCFRELVQDNKTKRNQQSTAFLTNYVENLRAGKRWIPRTKGLECEKIICALT